MATGLRVLITGGNSGIGFEAARQLLQVGHHVILACRDSERAQNAVDALKPVAQSSGATVESAQLDLSSLEAVRRGAAAILQRHDRLDVLLCNAGVMSSAGRGAPLQHTPDGFETTIGVNHLGHFLLVHLLLPALAASPAARVVVVSSELHRKATSAAADSAAGATATGGKTATANAASGPGAPPDLPLASPDWLLRLRAPAPVATPAEASSASQQASTGVAAAAGGSYGLSGMQLYYISKLYNLWFTYRLAAMLPPHIVCNAVTPGWVPGTSLGRGAPWLARMVYQNVFPLLPFTVSLHEGARRVVAACVGPQEGAVRGRYFSRGAAVESSPDSREPAAAQALWELSEEAAGVKTYLPEGVAAKTAEAQAPPGGPAGAVEAP